MYRKVSSFVLSFDKSMYFHMKNQQNAICPRVPKHNCSLIGYTVVGITLSFIV